MVVDAEVTALGSGAHTTADILDVGCRQTADAAVVAAGYSLNGFSDRLSPAQDGPKEIYLISDFVLGFANGVYWRSRRSIASTLGSIGSTTGYSPAAIRYTTTEFVQLGLFDHLSIQLFLPRHRAGFFIST